MEIVNVFSQVPNQLSEELFQELVKTDGVKIERIVSDGHASPPGFWYDQQQHEWVLVLKGSAGLAFADSDRTILLKAGDAIVIPAHRKHRVEWTDPNEKTLWLAVHY